MMEAQPAPKGAATASATGSSNPRPGEEAGEHVGGREEDDHLGLVALVQRVPALEDDVPLLRGHDGHRLHPGRDELGSLLVALAFKLPGDAAREEGLEVLAQAMSSPRKRLPQPTVSRA